VSAETGYIRNLSAASSAFGSAFSSAATNKAEAPKQTLLQRIGVNVQAPSVNAGAMMRDATKVAPDLSAVKQSAAAATNECKAELGNGKEGFDQAKAITVEMAKQAAPDLGYKPGQVDATFGISCTVSETATTAIAGKGLGSVATHLMEGTSALNELHNESESLKPDEAKALMDEVASRINGQSTMAQSQSFMAAFDEPSPMDFSNAACDLSDCTGDDLVELMEASYEQQPETQELLATLAKLDEVHDNHQGVEIAHERVGIHSSAIEAADLGSLTAMAPIIQARQFGVEINGPLSDMMMKPPEIKDVPAFNHEAGLNQMAMSARAMG